MGCVIWGYTADIHAIQRLTFYLLFLAGSRVSEIQIGEMDCGIYCWDFNLIPRFHVCIVILNQKAGHGTAGQSGLGSGKVPDDKSSATLRVVS